MTAIPAKSAFTGASVTEGEFKTALETLIDYLTGMLGSSGTQASALQALGALGGTVTARATAYTVVAADRGQVLSCSGTWTLSLTSAATLGSGFVVAAVNSGSGVITIDPAGAETVNGNATKSISAGESVVLVSNGVNWLLISNTQAYKIGYQLFTSSGTFTVPTGVTKVKATIIGGGGGGSATDGGFGGQWTGYIDVTPNSAMPVTVGTGGAGGNWPTTQGGSGSSSSFGGATAYGGSGSNINGDISSGGVGRFCKPYTQPFKRPAASNATAPVAYSVDGMVGPGAGGSAYSDAFYAEASGGVGGLVLIEW